VTHDNDGMPLLSDGAGDSDSDYDDESDLIMDGGIDSDEEGDIIMDDATANDEKPTKPTKKQVLFENCCFLVLYFGNEEATCNLIIRSLGFGSCPSPLSL
jgi:hypothetical protein